MFALICLPFSAVFGIPFEDVGQDYITQIWTTEEGLAHNDVDQIVQDRSGFIWAATQAGLTRFDGRAFRDFPIPDGSQKIGAAARGVALAKGQGLVVLSPGDEVLNFDGATYASHPLSQATAGKALAEFFTEPSGTIWAGATTGELYRWEEGQVQEFGKADGIDRRRPSFSFAIDGMGRTWIGTGSFFGYYENHRLVRFGESLGRIITIAPARSGGLWILADGQLKKLEDGKLATVLADPPWVRLNASARHLFEDSTGCLWIAATHNGLFCLQAGVLTHPSLPWPTIQAFLEDREGNLWLGTDGEGLIRLRRKRFRCYDNAAGLPYKLSTSVCEDTAGNVWLANGKGGLIRTRNGAWDQVWSTEGSFETTVVCPDPRGGLWVGTLNGLYRMTNENPGSREQILLPFSYVSAVLVAANGDVWVSGRKPELAVLSGGSTRSLVVPNGSFVTALAEDPPGTIWLGCESGALLQYQGGELRPVPIPDFSRQQINCLAVAPSGGLWIGTTNGLLFAKNGHFTRLSEADGLWDRSIRQIQEDDRGHLWLGSRRGYFYVALEELHALLAGRLRRVNSLAFGKDEGLPGVQPVTTIQPASWKDHRGTLWFATHRGVISIDPTSLSRSTYPVPVFVDEVRLDDQAVEPGPELRIPPGNHHVEFRFATPAFASDNVRVRHQLRGIDPGWIETAAGQPASYSNLSPGRYLLRVTARDGAGQWNPEQAVQTVVALPAWWQFRWVRAAAGVLLLGLVAAPIHFISQLKFRQRLARVEKERAVERERARIAREIHDELGSGVTGVRFLVSRLKNGFAALSQSPVLEQLTRQTQQLAFDLERVVWTVQPRSHSFEQLVTFIGRFAQNLLQGSAVKCVIQRPAELPPYALPPEAQHHILAVAKEAITNALKHSHSDEVHIETECTGGFFTLTIRDAGIGFDPEAPKLSERNGLSNMRSRVAEIGGRLDILSQPDRGTTICLHLPFHPRPENSPLTTAL